MCAKRMQTLGATPATKVAQSGIVVAPTACPRPPFPGNRTGTATDYRTTITAAFHVMSLDGLRSSERDGCRPILLDLDLVGSYTLYLSLSHTLTLSLSLSLHLCPLSILHAVVTSHIYCRHRSQRYAWSTTPVLFGHSTQS